ncbi:hypothetical protein TNCV_4171251 [Trichonephila clavipes]|nr:hypothetical protein TNCV_4171251 [Trichonephila clavipes]
MGEYLVVEYTLLLLPESWTFRIKIPNFSSVFRSELIAVRKGDETSLDILNLLDRISSNHCVHFQWVPSHVGIHGNEKTDFLARTAAEEGDSLWDQQTCRMYGEYREDSESLRVTNEELRTISPSSRKKEQQRMQGT